MRMMTVKQKLQILIKRDHNWTITEQKGVYTAPYSSVTLSPFSYYALLVPPISRE